MINQRKGNEEFIDGVWSKVRYLEYMKREEDIIRENNRAIVKRRLRLLAAFAAALVFVIIPLILVAGYDTGALYVSGIILLGCGAAYEYLYEKEIFRRT
ncbi:MAG: hypothetical protein ACOZCL_18435 [Bacillota bacterium]